MLELLGACIWMAFMSIFGAFGQNAPESPKDPASRARHFVSHCLTALKNELYGAQVLELEPERLVYRTASQQQPRVLSFQSGQVLRDGHPISELGENGRINFERVSPGQLKVDIASEVNAQARHQASVRLSVQS
ncbi:hypothetical protein JST97_32355 [bacterium]|nr:hypothetical protein [bacterium]